MKLVNWWDVVFVTWQVQFYNNWNALAPIVNWLQPYFTYLADQLGSVLAVILYFPISMLYVVVQLLNEIIASLAGVINAIIDLGNSLTGLFTDTFTGVFPSAWMAIIGTIVLLNVALRAYYFAKDISILGFKI
jgi:hypothetical protein